jgi:hypothetical protein
VSAAILGDDGQGHTTYALQQVELDGDHTRAVMTGNYYSFPLLNSFLCHALLTWTPATLVEGADHISYRLDHVSGSENLHLVLDCAISGGNRICSSDPAKALTLPARYMTLDVGNGAPQTGTGNGAPPTPTGGAGHKAAGSILAVVVAAAAQGLMLSW